MAIYDSATWDVNDAQWANSERVGRAAIQDRYKKFFNSNGANNTFFDLGTERTKLGISSLVNGIWQIDFMLTNSIEGQTEALLGPVALSFPPAAPMTLFPSVYGYLNHAAGQPPNIQAFPSGARAPIKTGLWYTLKIWNDTSNGLCKVYIDGNEYSNFLIEPANPTDFFDALDALNVTFQVNIKRLPSSAFLAIDNYYVTDNLNFVVPRPRAIDMTSDNYMTKEYFR